MAVGTAKKRQPEILQYNTLHITKSRKGIFMTAIAVIIMILLFSWAKLTTPQQSMSQSNFEADRIRIITMNKYIDVLENHISNSISVSGYLALQNISDKIMNSQITISSPTGLSNALYDCLWLNSTKCMSLNQSLNYSINNLTVLARNNLNIDTKYTINSIKVQDSKPFELLITANVTYTITDSTAQGIANWTATSIINSTVNVEGMRDPLYMYYYRNGTFVDNKRVFSSTTVKTAQFNDSAFTTQFYPKRQYIATTGKGLTVLQRFTQNWSVQDTQNGLISIITISELNTTRYSNVARQNLSLADAEFVNKTRYSCINSEVVGLNGFIDPNDAKARIGIGTLSTTFNYGKYSAATLNSLIIKPCLS